MRAIQRLTATGAFRTVRARLLFWILAVTVPIYGGALYMSHAATASSLEADAEHEADELATRLAAGLDAVINPIEGGIVTVAHQLEEVDPPQAQYPQRIRGILAAWPEVYGSTIAVETTGNSAPVAPYMFRRGGQIDSVDLARDSYGYRNLAWYREAADTGKPVWSLPYFDAGGGEIWMVTYSVPFFRRLPDGQRVLAGVVTADIDLEWVRKTARDVALGPIGMGWLASSPGAAAFTTPIGNTTQRVAKFDHSLDEKAIRTATESMLARNVSFELLPGGESTAYLAVRNLQTLHWHLVLLIPRSELMAQASELLKRQLWLGAAGLVLLVVAISLVAAGIARPVHALALAVGKAGEDDLNFELPESARRDEIGVLTQALRRMRDSLQNHVRLRAESLAVQARLEHELEIAASIQQSMLPGHDPGSHLPASVEIAGALVPARQVGGDLYDYFLIGDSQILFAVGDVSDKGIPAALFMARLSGLLRVLGVSGDPPHRLLRGINLRLCEGNDACMFVTVGCGLLDLQTGAVRYASAGHEAPLLRLVEGDVRAFVTENGAAIGIEAQSDYQLREGSMAPGDTLVLFTDGVTEAEAHDGSQFGIERLRALLQQLPNESPAGLVGAIVDCVGANTPGFHATDDLTALAVKYRPPEVQIRCDSAGVHWLWDVEVTPGGMLQARQRVQAILEARGVVADCLGTVQLILEEVLTNIVRTAGATRLSVDLSLTHAEIILTIRDDGQAFNPLLLDTPDLDAPVSDRPEGGLGVYLVRQLADDCGYSRIDEWNVLQIRLTRNPVQES